MMGASSLSAADTLSHEVHSKLCRSDDVITRERRTGVNRAIFVMIGTDAVVTVGSQPVEETVLGFSVATQVAAEFDNQDREPTAFDEMGGPTEDFAFGSLDVDLAGVKHG
jgi:hypothetical protein